MSTGGSTRTSRPTPLSREVAEALTATTTLEPRRLSNREKARLQGFPDTFVFEHGCTGTGRNETRSMYPRVRRQIGNAVPPPAAAVIVSAVADVLQAAGVRPRGARELAAARKQARQPVARLSIPKASGE